MATNCHYCGKTHAGILCPRIKKIEFFPDGSGEHHVVEFWEPQPTDELPAVLPFAPTLPVLYTPPESGDALEEFHGGD